MKNQDLFTQDADGNTKPATTDQILAAACQALAHRVRTGVLLSSPKATPLSTIVNTLP